MTRGQLYNQKSNLPEWERMQLIGSFRTPQIYCRPQSQLPGFQLGFGGPIQIEIKAS